MEIQFGRTLANWIKRNPIWFGFNQRSQLFLSEYVRHQSPGGIFEAAIWKLYEFKVFHFFLTVKLNRYPLSMTKLFVLASVLDISGKFPEAQQLAGKPSPSSDQEPKKNFCSIVSKECFLFVLFCRDTRVFPDTNLPNVYQFIFKAIESVLVFLNQNIWQKRRLFLVTENQFLHNRQNYSHYNNRFFLKKSIFSFEDNNEPWNRIWGFDLFQLESKRTDPSKTA